MKKLSCLFLFTLFSAFSFAQWTWQNPLPQGNSLGSTCFTDENTGYAVGSHGTIIKTIDGGSTWTILPTGTTKILTSVHFTDASTGYAVGGTIIKTTNGGVTWTETSGATGTQLNSVFFPNANTGYAAGGNKIMKTQDAGLTWNVLPGGISFGAWSIFFTDVNTGYTAGDGGIFKTIDGGLTWTMLVDGTTLTWGLESIWFTDANTGYAVGGGKTILKTINGGQTWTTMLSGADVYLYSVYFSDDSTGYVVGGDGYVGTILKTTNAGLTWTALVSGTSKVLNSVYFVDANTGYVVGLNGIILKTSNGGTTWTILSSGPSADLYSVNFPDMNTGYAVGNNGIIIKTGNGGSTWSALSSGTTELLNSVYFTDVNTGYAAGGNWWSIGTILKTSNGGTTWNSLPVGTVKSLHSVHFIGANTGFAVGDSGTIVKTGNGGQTWITLSSGITDDLYSVYFTDANTGYAVGGNNSTYIERILKTTDGGTTWTILSNGSTNPLYSVYFPDASTGYAVGWHGTIIKTSNGGSTWTALSSGTPNPLLSVYFSDTTTGYAVGEVGTILKTTNGGITWTALPSGTEGYLHSVFFTGPNTGYTTGWSGIILKTGSGGCHAAFTVVPDSSNNPPYTYHFIDQSTGNIVTWFWSFGDGTTQTVTFPTSPNVTHTYAQPGTYVACLSIQGIDSTCYDYICDTIVVGSNSGCIANFTYSDSANTSNPTQFVDLSQTNGGGPITSWNWNFGNPVSGSNNFSSLQNPVHLFSAAGSFIVCLTIQGADSSCYDVICKTIIVGNGGGTQIYVRISGIVTYQNSGIPMPNHAVTWGLPEDTLIGPRTVYTNSSGLYADSVLLPQGMTSGPAYEWTQYECEGGYLFISDAFGPPNYKLHQDFFPNCEPNLTCQAKMEISAAGVLTVQFEDHSTGGGTSRIWDFGDGYTSTIENPIHTYSSQENYEVTLSIANNVTGCSSIKTKIIHFADSLLCNASFSYSNTANPMTIQFQDNSSGGNGIRHWYFFDDDTSNLVNPQHTFRQPGLYLVLLTIGNSESSCHQTTARAVLVPDSIAGCQAMFTYYPDSSNMYSTIHFIDQSTGNPESWIWSFGDSTAFSTEQNPVHVYPGPGTYMVCLTITANNGTYCTSTYCQNVVVADSVVYHQIYGQVFAGNFPLQLGLALIFSLDSNLNYAPYIDVCSIDSNGVYYFTMVPGGNYLVYAIPFDSNGYLPTYYGDVLNWAQATVIVLGEPNNPYNINLIPAGYMALGPGSIAGQVNMTGLKSSMMDKMTMLLLDEDGHAISFVMVSKSGSFIFPTMDYGTYYLHAEMSGITSDYVKVVLTPEKPHADVVMTFEGKHILGINDGHPGLEAGVIYPNPAVDKFNLALNLTEAVTVKFEIFNPMGQMATSMVKSLDSGHAILTIPVSSLASGIYMLRISSDKGINITRKLLIAK